MVCNRESWNFNCRHSYICCTYNEEIDSDSENSRSDTINKEHDTLTKAKALANKLFFTENNILYEYQFDFRKSHSTKLALFEIAEGMYQVLDNKEVPFSPFIDLSKALDINSLID